MKTFTSTVQEVCISTHPNFTKKVEKWGIRAAHWTESWYDHDEGVEHESEFVPEDRSGYKPELDGMSMSDMWDYKKGEWGIEPPGMEGVMRYLKPRTIRTFPCYDIQADGMVSNQSNA